MGSDNYNCIFITEGFPFPLSHYDSTFVRGRHLSNRTESSRPSGFLDVVLNYFEELKSNTKDRRIIGFLADLVTPGLTVNVTLEKKVFDRLCRILNKPFLKIIYEVDNRQTVGGISEGRAAFVKRLDLKDILKESKPQFQVTHRVCSINPPSNGNCICDIILEWVEEPDKPPTKTIRLSAASILEKLFAKESSKDLSIVAGNGTEIRCHRIVFETNSDILSAMVSPTNGMKESITGTIQMPENSEQGLNHLIRYLYGMEVSTEDLSCDLVVELLKTAHKYELGELLEGLVELIYQKQRDWFTADDLLELYFHVKCLDGLESLQEYSLSIMLRFPHEIKTCERFKELKVTNSEAACDLVWKLFELKE